MGTLNIDRYHAAMGDASFKDVTRLRNERLSDAEATFYVTQRKLPFAPCLGHERLIRLLVDSQIDRPRLRFLEQDRGGLHNFAKAIEDIQFVGAIRTVRPGTIVSYRRNDATLCELEAAGFRLVPAVNFLAFDDWREAKHRTAVTVEGSELARGD